MVYVAIKDESDEDEAIALMTCVNKNDKWIIDSGCSHHMTGDKSKFITLFGCDRNSIRFDKRKRVYQTHKQDFM